MRHLCLTLIGALTAGALLTVGCSPSLSSSPTQAPSAPTKVAAATNTPAPATPTKAAVPNKKLDYPEKGKPITIIIGFTAGGVADSSTRVLAAAMEKELGTPIQIVNRPGASTQVGMTELVQAKADGYTLGTISIPTIVVTYLDPGRKANYTRQSFQPISMFAFDYQTIGVRPESQFKTIKDLVDAAKTTPGKISVGTAGQLGVNHLVGIALEQAAGVKFGFVHFPGAPEAVTALLGGHIDAANMSVGNYFSYYKSGQVRVLAVAASEPSEFMPDVRTIESQGFKVQGAFGYGLAAPAGTDKAVVDLLATTVKRVMGTPDYQQKIRDLGMSARYMDAAGFEEFWRYQEEWARPLVKIGMEQP